MSKIVVNRLKYVLPFIISESQSAFISNCLITDNVLVAYELIHATKLMKYGKKQLYAMQLDMSKAYNRIA